MSSGRTPYATARHLLEQLGLREALSRAHHHEITAKWSDPKRPKAQAYWAEVQRRISHMPDPLEMPGHRSR